MNGHQTNDIGEWSYQSSIWMILSHCLKGHKQAKLQRQPFQAWLLSNYTGKAIDIQCYLKLTAAQNQRKNIKQKMI